MRVHKEARNFFFKNSLKFLVFLQLNLEKEIFRALWDYARFAALSTNNKVLFPMFLLYT